MTTRQRSMTFADLMDLPDDGYLHELVRGEILRMPPPKGGHGGVEMALAEAIGRYLYNRALRLGWDESQGMAARDRLVGYLGGGEDGVRFSLPDDPDQVRGLDLLYLSPEQVARIGDLLTTEYIPEAPVLVAEVISPSESATYVDDKVSDLLAAGSQLIWLLYRRSRSVQVYTPDNMMRKVAAGDVLDGGDILPGFSVALTSLFR